MASTESQALSRQTGGRAQQAAEPKMSPDATSERCRTDPALAAYGGHVSDSGEGRWTIEAAIDEGVPTHVLSAALYERFASRGRADFASQVLSAMRKQFGGHVEKPAESAA